MRNLICILIFVISTHVINAQWVKQTINTTASFRGLSVVNEKIVWASGTDGTVIKTIDGGKTWNVMTVSGAEKLDFRDIEAFDANTAYILSIGNGESSRIYKTTDGGKTWMEQFRNKNEKAFFDAMACWDKNNCIAMSDPVDKKFVLIETKNGGTNWISIDTSKMPEAKEGEAAFAASGTCLIKQGKNKAFLVTGGYDARVFKSTDRGKTWLVYDTPIIKGTPGSGIFSIAMRDWNRGIVVGGNYEKEGQTTGIAALTNDGGITWKTVTGLSGYRSGAVIVYETIIAVGPTGSDISWNNGKTWSVFGKDSVNAVAKNKTYMVWAVGPNGFVGAQNFDPVIEVWSAH